jgi:hypothetical protein
MSYDPSAPPASGDPGHRSEAKRVAALDQRTMAELDELTMEELYGAVGWAEETLEKHEEPPSLRRVINRARSSQGSGAGGLGGILPQLAVPAPGPSVLVLLLLGAAAGTIFVAGPARWIFAVAFLLLLVSVIAIVVAIMVHEERMAMSDYRNALASTTATLKKVVPLVAQLRGQGALGAQQHTGPQPPRDGLAPRAQRDHDE